MKEEEFTFEQPSRVARTSQTFTISTEIKGGRISFANFEVEDIYDGERIEFKGEQVFGSPAELKQYFQSCIEAVDGIEKELAEQNTKVD